ncbi:hypothetical protein [Mangrovimonas cancribranchiae]|uniref:DKNYY family protein n=1 Tax=Mangrovimonas cancribranchiae TaxID=3080055 RepID=A0AAU6NWC7_9FLAO
MKKNIVLLILSLFLGLTVYSQSNNTSSEYSYEVGKPYEVIDGKRKFFVHNDKMVAIKMRRSSVYVQQFNTNSLEETIRKEYKEDYFLPKNYHPERMLQFNDKIYFFYSSWSDETQHDRLFYNTIDINTCEIDKNSVKVLDIEGELGGSFFTTMHIMGLQISKGMKFDFLTSQDNGKLLIQYRKKPEVKRDVKSYDIIGVNVFNTNDMSLDWSKEYKMPYTERRMDLLDFAVDNEGKGYILTKVFDDDSNDDKKKKRDENANYHIELFRLLKGETNIAKTKIELDKIFINGISLFETSNNQIYCAGYYNKGLLKGSFISKKHNKDSADGVVIFKLSKDGEILKSVTHEIPLDVINLYISKRAKKRNSKKENDEGAELQNMVLRDFVIHNNGSVTLIGEQFYVVRHRSQYTGTYYSYHYENILATKVNADGSLAWFKKIPKKQQGDYSQGGMSYTYLTTPNDLFVLFLDNVKNMDLPEDKYPYKHTDGKGGYLTSYKINFDSGNMSKSSVFDTRNLTDEFVAEKFNTDRVIKTSDTSFIVEFYKKRKEDVLVKIGLK